MQRTILLEVQMCEKCGYQFLPNPDQWKQTTDKGSYMFCQNILSMARHFRHISDKNLSALEGHGLDLTPIKEFRGQLKLGLE